MTAPHVFTGFGYGPAIFYDEVDHFQGRSLYANLGLTIQPNQNLT